MSKRYLRPSIQLALEVIAFMAFAFVAMINDFEICFESFAIIVGLLAITTICVLILKNWGRY